jgi:hypothetical protein
MLMAVIMLAWIFKKLGRRRKSRGKRCANENYTGENPAIEQTRMPEKLHDVVGSGVVDPRNARITLLEAQLGEKEAENIRLKKELTKHQNRNTARKENIKKYQEKNQEARRAKGRRKLAGSSTTGKDGSKGKRPGKPVGANGGSFTFPPGVKPTREKRWFLNRCTGCGASLEGRKPVNCWNHFILDIVRTPSGRGLELVIIKHMIYRYRCLACGKLVHKEFGPAAHIHYGLGFIAYVLADRTLRGGSWRGVAISLYQLIKDERFIPTITTFINWMKKIHPAIKDACKVLKDFIKNEKHAHVDETGLPKDSDNWWLWVVSTAHIVLYINSPTRGHVAIKDLFDEFNGILISDFWGAYNKLTVEQQKCLAHFVKTLKELEHENVKKGDKIKKRLSDDDALQAEPAGKPAGGGRGRPKKQPESLPDDLRAEMEDKARMYDKAFRQARLIHDFMNQAWGDGEMGYKAPMERRISPDEAVQRMQQEVIDMIRAEGVANHDIERLLKRCEKYADQFFTYLAHEGIPPDNNMAERMLRPFVVQRKISGNFINETVMESQAGLYSLLQTAGRNDGDFSAVLDALLRGKQDLVIKHLGLSDLVPRPPPDPDVPDPDASGST